jgi:N-acetylglutamate synthase-like GNAT family acetyltransferase
MTAGEKTDQPLDRDDNEQQATLALVHRAQWAEIAPFARQAARERVTVTDTSDATLWFKTVDARGRVTGFAGVAAVGRSKARIRALWVVPEHRGTGLGTALGRACVDYALAARFTKVEVLTFDPGWLSHTGFAALGTTPHGATRMVYTLTEPLRVV